MGQKPEGFSYGREFTTKDINTALQSDSPLELVPSADEIGHGTFLAGVACGNRDEENGFTGIAPLASICMVKCKQAKQNLRDFYRIEKDVPCYAESDLMMAVRYLWNQAVKRRIPLVICLGMGTNDGGHERGGVLGDVLQYYGDYLGTFVVAGVGNEGNLSHHYSSSLVDVGGSEDVELQIGNESGFSLELWTDAPQLYSVGLISPSGEYSGKTVARLGQQSEIRFLLEDTTVNIEYLLMSFDSGDECVRIRFKNPQEGVWRIRVFNEGNLPGSFHLWLPIREFISEGTYFLNPDPNVTICDPANNFGVITTAYYDGRIGVVVPDSGRGYTRSGQIKPDIASPGVEILGPLTAGQRRLPGQNLYTYRSGSSVATSVTAGTVALFAEWGMVRGNDLSMDTITVRKYLIHGADSMGMPVPNRSFGAGTLDLFGVFDSLRVKR